MFYLKVTAPALTSSVFMLSFPSASAKHFEVHCTDVVQDVHFDYQSARKSGFALMIFVVRISPHSSWSGGAAVR